MAVGIEIVLGWKLREFCNLFDVDFPIDPAVDYTAWEDWEKNIITLIDEDKLLSAQVEALNANPKINVTNIQDVIHANTTAGKREFSQMALQVYFDDDEMEEHFPDDVIVGISLSSRYYPVYLDWEDPCGGVWNFCFDDAKPMIKIFRDKLVEIEPIFKTAKVYVKEIFY